MASGDLKEAQLKHFYQPKHNLGGYLKKFGGDDEASQKAAATAVWEKVQVMGNAGRISGEYKVQVKVRRTPLTVTGIVQDDGLVRVSNFWRRK